MGMNMNMLPGYSKWILAALCAATLIGGACSAQVRTAPVAKRAPSVSRRVPVKPPADAADVSRTPPSGNTSTSASKTTPSGNTSTPASKVAPSNNTSTPAASKTLPGITTDTKAKTPQTDGRVIAPARKTGPVDFSAKLPQINTVSVNMICATSEGSSKSVILKWVVDNDWLPQQGFNLYRKGPGESDFKKIAGPIKENPIPAAISLPAVNGVSKTISIASLQKQARANVQIPADMLRAFHPAPTGVATSKTVFDELKQLRVKEFTPVTSKTRANFAVIKPDAAPQLNSYYQRFQVQRTIPLGLTSKAEKTKTLNANLTSARSGQKVAAISKTPVQLTIEARRALILGSLINKSVSDAMGLSYVDSGVKEGDTYEYQLRKITGAGDSLTPAACTITVGADPLPSKPEDLSACQLDIDKVALRWKLDDSKTSARVISYYIFRIQGGKRQLLNAQPLMVGPVLDGKDNYTDPIYYYTDKNVPVGSYQYELVGMDAFSRQTVSTKIDFVMADWETPQPVAQVTCAVNDGQVYLYWQPSARSVRAKPGAPVSALKPAPDNVAMYNIYRYDQEGSKVWTKLNDEPVRPPFLSPPVLNRRYASQVPAINRSSNLTFIDKTCQKDAYYLYTVTAVYRKNLIETAPSPAATVGVPDIVLPPAVANLSGKHGALVSQNPEIKFDARWAKVSTRPTAPRVKVRNLSFDPSVVINRSAFQQKKSSSNSTTADRPISLNSGAQKNARASQLSGRTAVKLPSNLIKANIDNSDLGGKVTLTWTASALKDPVHYKVYRSSGTGYKVVSGFDKLAPSTSVTSATKKASVVMQVPATLARSAESFRYTAANSADVRVTAVGKKTNLPKIQNKGVSLEFIKKVDLASVMDDSYQYLAETTSASFQDFLPKSRPMYYNYRVVPINRWGIEGKPASIQVRIGSTVAPPSPEVVSSYANSDGGVTVTLKPLENKEECAKYVIYRKPIDLAPILKNTKPLLTMSSMVPAAVTGGSESPAKQSGPLTFGKDMKITPASVAVSPTVAAKARDHGMRVRPILPVGNLEFSKNLREIMAKPDYEIVGEIGADAIDQNGYIRYNDSKNLVPNQLYSYTVMAVDVDSWKSQASKPETASPWKVSVPPVSDLKAMSSGNGISLSWKPPVGEIMGYVVLKGVAKNTDYVQVSDTIKDATFTDFSVIKGRTYSYRVQAVDPLGNLSEPVLVECLLPK